MECYKGTTINDLEGPKEIEKKNSEALLQKKKFRRVSSRKKIGKAFQRKNLLERPSIGKEIWRGYRDGKINSFPNFPPPQDH